MKERVPKVSISMLAYNVGKFIEPAIESALSQKVDFEIELVISEDCSEDNTREICEAYAAKYPDIIRLLPSDINRGIPANTARLWRHCRGEYIAICDSDDIWTDPMKLKTQVQFLDDNFSYGAIYTDVNVISETGDVIDGNHDRIRARYASGKVFSKLLQGNFINNSTAVFRKALIDDYAIDEDRSYYSYDYLFWLHIASKSEIHFWNTKTTSYRKRFGGATSSDERLPQNRKKYLQHLPSILLRFDEYRPWPLTSEEKIRIFQKKLSVIFRNEADANMKWKILRLMPRYFPGIRGVVQILTSKYKRHKIFVPKMHSAHRS